VTAQARARSRSSTASRHLAVVLTLSVTGTLLFGILHALVITPIWWRIIGGLPFATLASAAMTWTYVQLVAAGHLSPGLRGGALFGAALWISVFPTTLFGAALRLTGLHRRTGNLELIIEIAIAGITGALVGALWLRSTRRAIECACVVIALVLAMAGPIPVTNGQRPQLLFLGFLPLLILAGMALSFLRGLLDFPKPGPQHSPGGA